MTDEQMQPFFRELLRVANGGSVAELRFIVSGMCPKTVEGAEEFLRMVQRMKTAMETVESVASEGKAYAYRANS